MRPEPAIGRGILQESHDFLKLFLRLVDPSDVSKANLNILLDKYFRLALAHGHDRSESLPHPSRDEAPDKKENRSRNDPGEQRREPAIIDGA